jgi:hypothetical protein
MVLVVNATPRPLYPLERPGIHCIGGWVCPKSGLDGYRKTRPHRDSVPEPTSPWVNQHMYLIKLIYDKYQSPTRFGTGILSDQRNTTVALVEIIKVKFLKGMKLKSLKLQLLVLKLCDSRSKYKFVAIYLLYAVCVQ